MDPFVGGMILQTAGGLFGGRARKRAAEQARRDAFDTGDLIVQATREDQARAIEYRDADQARMDARGATGLDLVKLRDDAQKAGFNPLTVLQNTGAAGYEKPGVLTTPFLGMADAFASRAGLVAGVGPMMVETAGYFGDALSGAGAGLMGLSERQANQRHEMEMLRTEIAGRNYSKNNGFAQATKLSASPISKEWDPFTMQGPEPLVNVFTPDGWYALSPGAARRLRVKNGETLIGEDWEALAGDVISEAINIYQAGVGGLAETNPIKRTGYPNKPGQGGYPRQSTVPPTVTVSPGLTWGKYKAQGYPQLGGM